MVASMAYLRAWRAFSLFFILVYCAGAMGRRQVNRWLFRDLLCATSHLRVQAAQTCTGTCWHNFAEVARVRNEDNNANSYLRLLAFSMDRTGRLVYKMDGWSCWSTAVIYADQRDLIKFRGIKGLGKQKIRIVRYGRTSCRNVRVGFLGTGIAVRIRGPMVRLWFPNAASQRNSTLSPLCLNHALVHTGKDWKRPCPV